MARIIKTAKVMESLKPSTSPNPIPSKEPDPVQPLLSARRPVPVDKPTLRDAFAMHALEGLTSRGRDYSNNDELATICYRIADAMLRARRK